MTYGAIALHLTHRHHLRSPNDDFGACGGNRSVAKAVTDVGCWVQECLQQLPRNGIEQVRCAGIRAEFGCTRPSY